MNFAQIYFYAQNKSGFEYPFDQTFGSSASLGLSLRLLNSTYTGPAVKIRRSSDNTTKDIYFVNNLVDTAEIASFCGTFSGFVDTWYNQDGSIYHAYQATAANQPRIYNAGSMETLAGKPAIFFDGSNDFMRVFTYSTVALTTFAVAASFSATSMILEHGTGTVPWPGPIPIGSHYLYTGGGAYMSCWRSASGTDYLNSARMEDAGVNSPSFNGYRLNTYVFFGLTNSADSVGSTGGAMRVWNNGTEKQVKYSAGAVTRTLDNNNSFTKTLFIGSRNGASIWASGRMHELLHFQNNKGYTDVNNLNTNINNYWNIY